jgi:hypothetical protein
MRTRSGLGTIAAILAAAMGGPAAAQAAPPPNDNRADAQVVSPLPATVDGTTVESTREADEPASQCATEGGTVWYRVTPGRDGRLIADLTANGDLDAVIDVYRVRRSQIVPQTCAVTDEDGKASIEASVAEGQTYLVRVSRLANSVEDTFRLSLQLAQPNATPPGPSLPSSGANGTLDRVLNPSDAWSVVLRPGVTYRFNLYSGACTPLLLYRPGVRSFENSSPVRGNSCGGYLAFTPDADAGGRYSLVAVAPRGRRPTDYHLEAGRAGSDDIAPGRFIRNYARVGGSLDARHLDVVDLYRFDVTRRSDLDLRLTTDSDFTVTVIRAGGRRIATGQGLLTLRVPRGRYFALVRARRGASGRYRLRRISRTITHTRPTVNGRRGDTVAPGSTVTLGAKITPGARGRVVLRLERFDPVLGWQFAHRFRVRSSSSGVASVAYHPPAVGRYRVSAKFLGTRAASPSGSVRRFATFKVQGPLEE